MPNLIVAEKVTIDLGTLNLECYSLPNLEYRWSMAQISEAAGYNKGWLSNAVLKESSVLKALVDIGFTSSAVEVKVPTGTGGVVLAKTISTEDVIVIFQYAAQQGKKEAWPVLKACLAETLERRADNAFGKRRSEEEYQQRTKARSLGKVTRRLCTEATKDYMLRHTELSENSKNWMYKSVTDKLYKLLFQKNAKQLRELLSCTNPRDSLSARDLQEVERIEALATKLIDGMDMHPVSAIENAFKLQMMVSKEPDISLI